jgi:hypothetical protein
MEIWPHLESETASALFYILAKKTLEFAPFLSVSDKMDTSNLREKLSFLALLLM